MRGFVFGGLLPPDPPRTGKGPPLCGGGQNMKSRAVRIRITSIQLSNTTSQYHSPVIRKMANTGMVLEISNTVCQAVHARWFLALAVGLSTQLLM